MSPCLVPLCHLSLILKLSQIYNGNIMTLEHYRPIHLMVHITDHKYTLNYTISNVELSDAGIYTCLSFFDTTTAHPYIKRSGTSASTTMKSL